MKIKNNTLANLSVGSLLTRGQASKKYMTVPGESTLELDDALWLAEFEGPAAKMLEAGNLEVTLEPKKSEEQIAADKEEKLAAAKALIAEAEVVEPKPEAKKPETKARATPK